MKRKITEFRVTLHRNIRGTCSYILQSRSKAGGYSFIYEQELTNDYKSSQYAVELVAKSLKAAGAMVEMKVINEILV